MTTMVGEGSTLDRLDAGETTPGGTEDGCRGEVAVRSAHAPWRLGAGRSRDTRGGARPVAESSFGMNDVRDELKFSLYYTDRSLRFWLYYGPAVESSIATLLSHFVTFPHLINDAFKQ